MEKLQFYIRHHDRFLQEKLLLVFKSDEARDHIRSLLKGSRFEKISRESAEHAVRIGMKGKTIPYGYTHFLTDSEMDQLDPANWDKTVSLIAEGNERLYEKTLKKEEKR